VSEQNSGLLFEIAPEERDGQSKKQAKRAPKKADAFVSTATDWVPADAKGYLASIDGHYSCDRCGITLLDLVEVRKVDGHEKWLVTCGWWCMNSWLVDPIPGLIDEQDRKDTQAEVFRVRDGLFAGKTFDEIATTEVGLMYIQGLVKKSNRTVLAEAAAKWLTESKVWIQ
jgi:hypothetical protein